MRGMLSGLGNAATWGPAREALRPWVLHAVEYLRDSTGEDQRARVRDIDRNAYPGKRAVLMDEIKRYLGRSVTSPLSMFMLYPEYFHISDYEAVNVKQGEGTMVTLRENRPEHRPEAKGNLDTLGADADEGEALLGP